MQQKVKLESCPFNLIFQYKLISLVNLYQLLFCINSITFVEK